MKVWQRIVAFRWTGRRSMRGAFDLALLEGVNYADAHGRDLEWHSPAFMVYERLTRERIKALFLETIRRARNIDDFRASKPEVRNRVQMIGRETAREVLGIPPHEWRPILEKFEGWGVAYELPVGCATCGARSKPEQRENEPRPEPPTSDEPE